MDLEKLLSEGLIESIGEDSALVEKAIHLARRDIASARRNLEAGDYDWALAIAYNAMLQAGRALMFKHGYRPAGSYKHLGVVQFAAVVMKSESGFLVRMFNRVRVRRHRVVYEESETVTREEAKKTVENAEMFVRKAETLLKSL